jgi:hypothetical protein
VNFSDLIICPDGQVIEDLHHDLYHQKIDPMTDALSSSDLKDILKSPWHYIGKKPVATKATALGTACHCLTLEAHKFGHEFDIAPADLNFRSTVGREYVEKMRQMGKTPISRDEHALLQAMATSARAHPMAQKLLASGHAELSIYWTDRTTGVRCKVRPDWLNLEFAGGEGGDTGAIVDLKTAKDASKTGFQQAICNYAYHLSAAYYIDGVREVLGRTLPFYFLVVEKEPPYAAAVYRLDEESVEAGRRAYRQALNQVKACRDANHWPAYQPDGGFELIQLPRHAAGF